MKIHHLAAGFYLPFVFFQSALAQQKPEPPQQAQEWIALGNEKMQEARNRASHDFKAAEVAFLKALEIRKDSTEAMLGMAWVKNSEHLFDEGRSWAEKALALNPRLADAYALLGDHAVEIGEYDVAFDHYQSAIDIRADLSTYSRASHLLWITGDPVKAQTLMGKAIQSGGPFPENTAWCQTELAAMQFSLGATLPAEMLVKKAREAAPANPRVLTMMARILAAKGETDEAIAFYEKSISITPSHPSLAALVDLYKVKGDEAKMEKAFLSVVHFHDPDPNKSHEDIAAHGHLHPSGQGNAELAMFLAKHDRELRVALKEAEQAYETYKNIRTEEALAWCHYKLGNHKAARLMILRATKWNTREPSLFFHRGMIYAKLGENEKAIADLNEALYLNPNFDPLDADLARRTLAEISPKAVTKKE